MSNDCQLCKIARLVIVYNEMTKENSYILNKLFSCNKCENVNKCITCIRNINYIRNKYGLIQLLQINNNYCLLCIKLMNIFNITNIFISDIYCQ